MLSAFFGSVGTVVTEALSVVGSALTGAVNLIYDATANEGAGALTNFGILVSIPVGAGLLWVAYRIIRNCITIR